MLNAQVYREDSLAEYYGELAFEANFNKVGVNEVVAYMTEKATQCETIRKFSVSVWKNGRKIYGNG